MIFLTVLQGNYINALKRSGLPEHFAAEGTEAEIKDTLQQDLPRTAFVDFHGRSFEDLKKTWEHPSVSLCYTQGNITGKFFSAMLYHNFVLHSPHFVIESQRVPETERNLFLEESSTLSFAYFDDNKQPCGFSIAYSKKDKTLWVATVIQSTTAPPQERYVTVCCNRLILMEHNPDIRDSVPNNTHALTTFLSALNSQKISQILMKNPIFDSTGTHCKPAIEKLSKRIKAGFNIDDYVKFVTLVEALFNKESCCIQILLILAQTRANAQFFNKTKLRDIRLLQSPNPLASPLLHNLPKVCQEACRRVLSTLTQLSEDYKRRISEMKLQLEQNIQNVRHQGKDIQLQQSLVSRHRGKLALLGTGLVIFIGITLAVTGVLAPIGIAIPAGFATTLSIIGSSVSASFSLLMSIKTIRHEKHLRQYRKVLQTRIAELTSEYDTRCTEIKASYEPEIFSLCDEITEASTPFSHTRIRRESNGSVPVGHYQSPIAHDENEAKETATPLAQDKNDIVFPAKAGMHF